MDTDEDSHIVSVGPVFDEGIEVLEGTRGVGLPVSTTGFIGADDPISNRNSDAV